MAAITPVAGGVVIAVQVQPRASRTEYVGRHGDAIKIRLAAPPVEGEANDELVRFLARHLGVARGEITIASGATGKRKRVRIDGATAETVERAFAI
jgi:uncharacterized protein (TIGR00251 family)